MPLHHWSPICERPLDLQAAARLDPTGVSGPTRGQAAGPDWRRCGPGLYVPVDASEPVEQRILEQSARLNDRGGVTAWAALRWRGANFFDGTDVQGGALPIPLVTGGCTLRRGAGTSVSKEQFAPTERELVADVPCATVQRALFDEMRREGSLRQAVVAVDMSAAARLISIWLMSRYVLQRPAWTGVPLVRMALLLADENSRSPQETRMRLVWVIDAGLPVPLCNRPVFDLRGRLLGYPDLFDPVAGVVGEYDGADHKERERHRSDVAREELFRDHGLEYFAVVGGDLRDHGLVVRRMHNARARAAFRTPERRQWTLTPPSWWTFPPSLDEILETGGQACHLTHT